MCRPSETWHRVKKKPKNIWCKIFARRTNCRSMPRTCSTFILLFHCWLHEVLKQTATANLCVNISSASSLPVRAMGLGKCAWKCVGAIKGNIFVLFVQHTQRVRRVDGLVPNSVVLRMEWKCCFSSVVMKNSRADHRIFHTHTSAPRAQHNFFLSMKNSLYGES